MGGALSGIGAPSTTVCQGANQCENAISLAAAEPHEASDCLFMLGRTLVLEYASSREEAEAKNDVAGGARVTPDP